MTDKQIIIDVCPYQGECSVSGCKKNDDGCFVKQLFEERYRVENQIVELNKTIQAKEQECESLREDIKDIASLLDLDIGEEYNFGNIEMAIKDIKQECERLKEAIKTKTGKDYINEIQDITMKYECHQKSMGVCWWGKYGKETKCIGIKECHKRELEIIQKLETELDQLKDENERLRGIANRLLEKRNKYLDKWEKYLIYRKALIEVKELAEHWRDEWLNDIDEKQGFEEILQKISEVK